MVQLMVHSMCICEVCFCEMFLQGSPVFHLQDSAINTGLYCRWLLDGSTLGMPLGDALGILLGDADGIFDG